MMEMLGGVEICLSPWVRPILVGYRFPKVQFDKSAKHREWRRLLRERQKHAKPIYQENAYFMMGKLVMAQETLDRLSGNVILNALEDSQRIPQQSEDWR